MRSTSTEPKSLGDRRSLQLEYFHFRGRIHLGSAVEPILKTENLWKTYRSGKVQVPALRGVNFEVLPGEFVAVMGPSGCGKSTLLYVIGGLAQASKGRVLVDGNDLAAMNRSEERRVGKEWRCP